MADRCLQTLDSMLDVAAKTETESWFLIDKLHLAPDSVLSVLKKRLQRAVRTKGKGQALINNRLQYWRTSVYIVCCYNH